MKVRLLRACHVLLVALQAQRPRHVFSAVQGITTMTPTRHQRVLVVGRVRFLALVVHIAQSVLRAHFLWRQHLVCNALRANIQVAMHPLATGAQLVELTQIKIPPRPARFALMAHTQDAVACIVHYARRAKLIMTLIQQRHVQHVSPVRSGIK